MSPSNLFPKFLPLALAFAIVCGNANGQTVTLMRDFTLDPVSLGIGGVTVHDTDVYLTGTHPGFPYYVFVGRYSAGGKEQWSRPLVVSPAMGSFPTAISSPVG